MKLMSRSKPQPNILQTALSYQRDFNNRYNLCFEKNTPPHPCKLPLHYLLLKTIFRETVLKIIVQYFIHRMMVRGGGFFILQLYVKIQSFTVNILTSQQILSIVVPSINNRSKYKCLLQSFFFKKFITTPTMSLSFQLCLRLNNGTQKNKSLVLE